MSKVITFSRTFPPYHPKAGQPTNFVSKIWKGLYGLGLPDIEKYANELAPKLTDDAFNFLVDCEFEPKHHTIRAGHRFEAGDMFSPRVWGNDINPKSGKSGPYHSKQIIIAPDTEVKKVWSFDKDLLGGEFRMKGCDVTTHLEMIAKNDGLTLEDFIEWFPKPFTGQIICWNENIEY